MSELKREMPLIDELIDHADLLIKPAHSGVILLQQADSVGKMPFDLPGFGTVKVSETTSILSAIPKQWLVFCGLNEAQKLANDYANQVADENIIITDMSDQYIILKIAKKHARALLAKGCELDLSADVFALNVCARTLLAHINVVIWRTEDEDFNLLVDVSYAAHLWLWLTGASGEYAV
ncbi:MAG: hypothetical protein HRU29_13395 [Rhizobiales bacterium]|nr:hypothetical protein [Hyphomicrobiales bacterium]NRB15388.1 hypothetical protein [Hyphomicrobiales bacterium]